MITNLVRFYKQKTPRVETLGEQTWKPTTKCIEFWLTNALVDYSTDLRIVSGVVHHTIQYLLCDRYRI